MLVQALYNVVDTLFVGRAYGTESVQAIGGLSIAFPVQMIIMAFGIVLGTGGSSIISRALEHEKKKKPRRLLGTFFFPEPDPQRTYCRSLPPLPGWHSGGLRSYSRNPALCYGISWVYNCRRDFLCFRSSCSAYRQGRRERPPCHECNADRRGHQHCP